MGERPTTVWDSIGRLGALSPVPGVVEREAGAADCRTPRRLRRLAIIGAFVLD